MSTSNRPEDTMYIDEMVCEPINELGEVKDYNNAESSKRIFGGGEGDKNNFTFFGTSGRGSLSMDFFYGIVIIGFIYSVGDYIFNGMPQGIVAKKLQHA
jgi:hypothetical protein